MKKEFDGKNLGESASHLRQAYTYMIGTYKEDGSVNFALANWSGTIMADGEFVFLMKRDHKSFDDILARMAFTLYLTETATLMKLDYQKLKKGNITADDLAQIGLQFVKSTRVNAPLVEEFPLILECTFDRIYDEDAYGVVLVCNIVNMAVDEYLLNNRGTLYFSDTLRQLYIRLMHYYIHGEKHLWEK